MRKLEQAVLVEGKYDAARLTNLVDATILTTDGSRVFRDKVNSHAIVALIREQRKRRLQNPVFCRFFFHYFSPYF